MQPVLDSDQRNADLLRRAKAIATFGTFTFAERRLDLVLAEAVRVSADCLGVPLSKIYKFEPLRNRLHVIEGYGWRQGVVNCAASAADESSPQGRAFISGKPEVCGNILEANDSTLADPNLEHRVLSTVDVLIAARDGPPFGVLEVGSKTSDAFDEHDIDFLTAIANILGQTVATANHEDDLQRTIVRMKELIDEKEVLTQELKHRVRNSLHLVYGLLSAELDSEHSATSIVAFRAIALRVMGLAQVFDHLLGIGMNKIINFGEYVRALCENLPELYDQDNVKLTCVIEPILFGLDEATALGVIITELVNNAYMHAFPDGHGTIAVMLNVESGQASLSIMDNGIGFVEATSKRRGTGLVRRLAQQVGGTLTVQSVQGTIWTLVFPIDPDAIVPESDHRPLLVGK